MQAKDILERSRAFAADMLKSQGRIEPMIAAHSKHGDTGVLPYDGSETAARLAVMTLKALKRLELLDYAVLISEAWMAKAPAGFNPESGSFRASEQPNRQEVVICHVVCVSGEKATGIWEIARDAAGKPSVGAPIMQGDDAKHSSWLDKILEPETATEKEVANQVQGASTKLYGK